MESMREILGGQKMQVIEGLNDDLRHAHDIISDLIEYTGRPGVCFFCAQPIVHIMYRDRVTEKAHNHNGEPHRCAVKREVPCE